MSEIPGYLVRLLEGVQFTAILTFGGFLLGAVFAVPVTVLRRSRLRPLRVLAIAYVEGVRGVPPIAWLFLLYFGLAQVDFRLSSLTAGVLGLGLISTAYLSEIYRAGLRAVPQGQLEAARAVGLDTLATYRRVVAPQAVVTIVPPAAAKIARPSNSCCVRRRARPVTSGTPISDATALSLSRPIRNAAAGLVYLALSLPLAAFARWLGTRLSARLAYG